MEIKYIEKLTGDQTYSFPVDGRKAQEVALAKEYGLMELKRFKGNGTEARRDGYFCGSCVHFKSKEFTVPVEPNAQDGYCDRIEVRVRGWGCCGVYKPSKGLFSSNPVI